MTDISDVCDETGIPAVRTGALTPAWPGCPRLAGPVATLSVRPAAADDPAPLGDIAAAMAGLAGSVLLVDLEGRSDAQCWGELLTACAQRAGVPGVIVNGAVRDVRGIADRKFPVFARGVYPARARGRLRLAAAGHPVMIDGQEVRPGDLAAADDDGLVVVPGGSSGLVLETARRHAARSARQLAALDAGADPRTVLLVTYI